MIIKILVTERQAIHPLRDQRLNAVLDTVGVTVIGEAGGQSGQHAQANINLAQQQPATIRGDAPTVKTPHHFPTT